MNPNHQIEHDHVAIRAMLATWAADDTSWDQPPLLFALVYDPDAGYGIVPVRPFNETLATYLGSFPPHAVLAQIVENVYTLDQDLPGMDSLRIAVRVCLEDPKLAHVWFPRISRATVACGLVLRNEVWMLPRDSMDAPAPKGSFAEQPGVVEALSWTVVVDDDTFHDVSWERGEVAPGFGHWSFDSDFYRATKDRQRIPTMMRKIVRLSARVSHMPWPDLRDSSPPGPFRRS